MIWVRKRYYRTGLPTFFFEKKDGSGKNKGFEVKIKDSAKNNKKIYLNFVNIFNIEKSAAGEKISGYVIYLNFVNILLILKKAPQAKIFFYCEKKFFF